MNGEEHILSLLVQNKPGVLSRVSGIFGRLGYNIESLCVAPTLDPDTSRITLMSRANSNFTDKVRKQLDRLVDVIEVEELTPSRSLQREVALLGLDFPQERRADILKAMEFSNGRKRFFSIFGIWASAKRQERASSRCPRKRGEARPENIILTRPPDAVRDTGIREDSRWLWQCFSHPRSSWKLRSSV